ncbi:hypothetical protein BB558_003592, partial [Smittium angustum]
MNSQTPHRVLNFSAGPSAIPLPVLQKAQAEFLDYKNTGMSIMELSHRSETFEAIIQKAEDDLRELLEIPSNYKVIFMQGGGTGEFAATHLNLMLSKSIVEKQRKLSEANPGQNKTLKCGYIVSGIWSKKGHQECKRLGGNAHVIVDSKESLGQSGYYDLPPVSSWDLPKPEETAYVYYCDNETIGGFEMKSDSIYPHIDPSVPIVCDMS